jgi:hypothetical protein
MNNVAVPRDLVLRGRESGDDQRQVAVYYLVHFRFTVNRDMAGRFPCGCRHRSLAVKHERHGKQPQQETKNQGQRQGEFQGAAPGLGFYGRNVLSTWSRTLPIMLLIDPLIAVMVPTIARPTRPSNRAYSSAGEPDSPTKKRFNNFYTLLIFFAGL